MLLIILLNLFQISSSDVVTQYHSIDCIISLLDQFKFISIEIDSIVSMLIDSYTLLFQKFNLDECEILKSFSLLSGFYFTKQLSLQNTRCSIFFAMNTVHHLFYF